MSAKAEKRQVSVQDRRDFDGRRSTTASVATASSRKITTTGRRRSQSANRKGAVLEQKLPSEKTGLEQKFHIREEGRETAGRIAKLFADWDSIGDDATSDAAFAARRAAAGSSELASGSDTALAASKAADDRFRLEYAGDARDEEMRAHVEDRPKVAHLVASAHEHARDLSDHLARMRTWQGEITERLEDEDFHDAEQNANDLQKEIARAEAQLSGMKVGLEESAARVKTVFDKHASSAKEAAKGSGERGAVARATHADTQHRLREEIAELQEQIHDFTDASKVAEERLKSATTHATQLAASAYKDKKNFKAVLEEMRVQQEYLERFNAELQAEDRLAHVAARDELVMKRLELMRKQLGVGSVGLSDSADDSANALAVALQDVASEQAQREDLERQVQDRQEQLEVVRPARETSARARPACETSAHQPCR